MGKRLEDLNLTDQPIPEMTTSSSEPADARDTDWYRFLEDIDELRVRCGWAEDTLKGIQETVERTRVVTAGQRQAIENIASARGRRGVSRRYEGFERRRGW